MFFGVPHGFLIALLESQAKKLAQEHDVFGASRENYANIAANCGVTLGIFSILHV